MMRITLSCVGGCAEYVPGGGRRTSLEALPEESLLDVLTRHGVPRELFMFALVNGERVELTHKLREGDDVVLVSAISGG